MPTVCLDPPALDSYIRGRVDDRNTKPDRGPDAIDAGAQTVSFDPMATGVVVHVEPLSLPTIERSRFVPAEERGRGGLGRVVEATDRHLERTVAVKELLDGSSIAARSRLVREALVTARLQHPGIVPVYDAGRWPTGEPFYTMKLVSGESLEAALRARSSIDERLALLPSVIAVADAVAYAHDQHVIHRDLKPSNVVLGAFGETVVIDWGLAKDQRASVDDSVPPETLYQRAHAGMTQVGTVLGTPAFMAPEQARGDTVDERADVYALGAMLYFLLAGAPPYAGADGSDICRQVIAGPPPPIEAVPGVPRDLAAVVSTAMARDPASRYPSARELAEELRRFQTGQLVRAHDYDRAALVMRWWRRNRAVVRVAAAMLGLLIVVAAFAALQVVRQRDRAEARSAELVLAQASAALERDPTEAIAWLKQYPADAGDWARAADIAVDAESRRVARHVLGVHFDRVHHIAYAPDGRTLATTDPDGAVLWDAATGARLRRLPHDDATVLAFSADGKLAVGSPERAILVHDLARNSDVILSGYTTWINDLVFSPDRRMLASAGGDGSIRLWHPSATEDQRLGGHDGEVTGLAFHPSLPLLFSTGMDRTLRAWDLDTGRGEVIVPSGAGTIAISPRGDRIACASDNAVSVWDAETRQLRQLGSHDAFVGMLAFAPDGASVASASDDGTVRVWTFDGRPPTVLRGHDAGVYIVTFAADGTLISGDIRGSVRVWRDGDSEELPGHRLRVNDIAVSPDGRHIATASEDGTARIWDLPQRRRFFRSDDTDVFALAFASDGAIVAGSREGTVRRWTAEGGEQRLGTHASAAYAATVTADSRAAITGGWDGEVILWNLVDGTSQRLAHGAKVWDVALSPDERWFASAGEDGVVRLWMRSGAALRSLTGGGPLKTVAIARDGSRIASTGDSGVIHVWTVETGEARQLTGHIGQVGRLAFSPDGTTLYSGGHDGTVRAWSLASGAGRVLGRDQRRVRAMAVSADGKLLAAAGLDRTVSVWRLSDGTRRFLRGHTALVRDLAFSPDGQWLASAGWDATVRLWDVESGLGRPLRGHRGRIHRVAFSTDGRALASSSEDGSVGIWRVEPAGREVAPRAVQSWLSTLTTAVTGPQRSLATPP